MTRSRLLLLGIAALGAGLVAASSVIARNAAPADVSPNLVDAVQSARALHPVIVRAPDGPPRVATDLFDHSGNPVTVGCATCHSTRPAPASPVQGAAQLTTFHQGLRFDHGDLACASCHNPTDAYASLRLADGTAVDYPRVLVLCAQCHGPVYVDWQHGAHGGMNGYWDLTRGPRTRNNCIDCHDPHAPQFPRMIPTFKPHDRFLSDRPPHAPANHGVGENAGSGDPS